MPVSIEIDPQLLGDSQNHVSVFQARLQNTAHLSHEFIRVHLATGKTKTALAGKSYPTTILATTRTPEFDIPAIFSSASQHLLYHVFVIRRSIRRMANLEFIPMILKYPSEGVPIDPLHKPPVPPEFFGFTSLYHNLPDFVEEKCKFLYY
jgi:hypothetical protein